MKKHLLLLLFLFLSTTSYSQVARGIKAFPVIGETIGQLESATGHIIDDIGVWHSHKNSITVSDSFRISDVEYHEDTYNKFMNKYTDDLYVFSKNQALKAM